MFVRAIAEFLLNFKFVRILFLNDYKEFYICYLNFCLFISEMLSLIIDLRERFIFIILNPFKR